EPPEGQCRNVPGCTALSSNQQSQGDGFDIVQNDTWADMQAWIQRPGNDFDHFSTDKERDGYQDLQLHTLKSSLEHCSQLSVSSSPPHLAGSPWDDHISTPSTLHPSTLSDLDLLGHPLSSTVLFDPRTQTPNLETFSKLHIGHNNEEVNAIEGISTEDTAFSMVEGEVRMEVKGKEVEEDATYDEQ
ncbi:unnamed protein product, partial [Choristocarpus tenellus]